MKKILALCLVITGTFLFTACVNNDDSNENSNQTPSGDSLVTSKTDSVDTTSPDSLAVEKEDENEEQLFYINIYDSIYLSN